MFAHGSPHSPKPDHLRAVHFQRRRRGPADWRQANDFRLLLVPRKMVGPSIAVWMEQGHFRLRHVIAGRGAIGFESIAHWARPAKIVERCLATGGTRNDVLELRRSQVKSSAVRAISTTVREAFANAPLKPRRKCRRSRPGQFRPLFDSVYRARVLSNVRVDQPLRDSVQFRLFIFGSGESLFRANKSLSRACAEAPTGVGQRFQLFETEAAQ